MFISQYKGRPIWLRLRRAKALKIPDWEVLCLAQDTGHFGLLFLQHCQSICVLPCVPMIITSIWLSLAVFIISTHGIPFSTIGCMWIFVRILSGIRFVSFILRFSICLSSNNKSICFTISPIPLMWVSITCMRYNEARSLVDRSIA